MKSYLKILIPLFFLSGSAFGVTNGPVTPIEIGNWKGGSYFDANSGAFSHCSAQASYETGKSFFTAIYKDGSWAIALSDPIWRLNVNSHIDLHIYIDDLGPIGVTSTAILSDVVYIKMPNSHRILSAFQKGNWFRVVASDVQFGLALTGTQPLISALKACVSREAGIPFSPEKNAPNLDKKAEVELARDKILTDAGVQYSSCINDQIKEIVPYSTESAEIITDVIITSCNPSVQKFIEASMAIYNLNRDEAEKIILPTIENRRKSILKDIVTYRAKVNKILNSNPKEQNDKQNNPVKSF